MHLLQKILLAVFVLIPFQAPLFRHVLRQFSMAIIPEHLLLPSFFSKRLSFFLTDFILFFLIAFLLYTQRKHWREIFWSGPSKYLFLFILSLLFSLGSSATSDYPLQYIRLFQWTLGCLFFVVVIHSFHAELIRSIAWIMVATSLFECAVAIAQFFLQHELGLKFLGEYSLKFGSFFGRVSGTFPHPNIFGGFHFFSLLSSCYLYIAPLSRKVQPFLLCLIALQILTLMLSFSRSALFATCLALTILFFFQARYFPACRTQLIKLGSLFAASLALCTVALYPQLIARGGIINYNSISQEADEERLIYNRVAWDMFKERPLFGVGFNNFELHSERLSPQNAPPLHFKVHNIYLLILAESGIMGFTLFVLFLITVLKKYVTSVKSPENLFLFSAFLGFLFIGCCDFYLLYTPHGRILLFGIAALLYAASRSSTEFSCQDA